MRISDWSSDVCSSDLWPLSSSVSAHISLPAKHQTETASSVIVQPLRRDRLRIERPLAAPLPERQHVAGIIASGAGPAIQSSAVEGGAIRSDESSGGQEGVGPGRAGCERDHKTKK